MQEWSNTWQLHFNISKCKVMYIGRNNPEHNYTMELDGNNSIIQSCDEEKDLGVTFDRTLTFDSHINRVVNKANSILSLIRRSFDYIDRESFLILYKSLVRPHVEYGNTIWHPLYKRQSIIVENVQRRATKLVKDLSNLSYGDRLKNLQLPSLKHRRLRGDLIQAYKIMTSIDNLDVKKFFNPSPCLRTRNSEKKVFISYSRTNLRKNYFTNRCAPVWNKLNYVTKNSLTLNAFKSNLDSELFMKDNFYTFDE